MSPYLALALAFVAAALPGMALMVVSVHRYARRQKETSTRINQLLEEIRRELRCPTPTRRRMNEP